MNNPSVIPFFHLYLLDRSQHVCVNVKLSAVGAIQTGVPQGSILGPLLFCIFINDLPTTLKTLLADDSSLDTSGKTLKEIEARLQKSITEVSDWCKKNRMCFHPEKTKCIGITTRQKHHRSPLCLKLEIYSETVTQVKEHRILGLAIDDELKSHVGNVCKTVLKNAFLMSQLKRYVNSQTLRICFISHIMPHINFHQQSGMGVVKFASVN